MGSGWCDKQKSGFVFDISFQYSSTRLLPLLRVSTNGFCCLRISKRNEDRTSSLDKPGSIRQKVYLVNIILKQLHLRWLKTVSRDFDVSL